MPTFGLVYGNYTFPAGWAPADVSLVSAVPVSKRPRTDGSKALTGTLEARRVLLRGGFIGGATDLRTKMDAMLRELHRNRGASLYLDTDRYLREVEVLEARLPFDQIGWGARLLAAEVELLAGDPFFYSTTETTDTWNAPASLDTRVVTNGGDAPARPEYRITVGGAGAQTIGYRLDNLTTGKYVTLAGAVTGGDVIKVNTQAETVLIGSTDKISLADGWLRTWLNAGNNTLKITITAGSITSIATVYRNAYY